VSHSCFSTRLFDKGTGAIIVNLTITFEPLAKLAPAEEAVFRIRAKGRRAGDMRGVAHAPRAGIE
jgi:hypothetical protein